MRARPRTPALSRLFSVNAKKKIVFFLLRRFSSTPGLLTLSFKKEGGEVFHVRITQSEQGASSPRFFAKI